jgi:hypothetical protein
MQKKLLTVSALLALAVASAQAAPRGGNGNRHLDNCESIYDDGRGNVSCLDGQRQRDNLRDCQSIYDDGQGNVRCLDQAQPQPQPQPQPSPSPIHNNPGRDGALQKGDRLDRNPGNNPGNNPPGPAPIRDREVRPSQNQQGDKILPPPAQETVVATGQNGSKFLDWSFNWNNKEGGKAAVSRKNEKLSVCVKRTLFGYDVGSKGYGFCQLWASVGYDDFELKLQHITEALHLQGINKLMMDYALAPDRSWGGWLWGGDRERIGAQIDEIIKGEGIMSVLLHSEGKGALEAMRDIRAEIGKINEQLRINAGNPDKYKQLISDKKAYQAKIKEQENLIKQYIRENLELNLPEEVLNRLVTTSVGQTEVRLLIVGYSLKQIASELAKRVVAAPDDSQIRIAFLSTHGVLTRSVVGSIDAYREYMDNHLKPALHKIIKTAEILIEDAKRDNSQDARTDQAVQEKVKKIAELYIKTIDDRSKQLLESRKEVLIKFNRLARKYASAENAGSLVDEVNSSETLFLHLQGLIKTALFEDFADAHKKADEGTMRALEKIEETLLLKP